MEFFQSWGSKIFGIVLRFRIVPIKQYLPMFGILLIFSHIF